MSVSWAYRVEEKEKDRSKKKPKAKKGLEEMQVGRLDDEVIVGIGLEDAGMGCALAKAEDLLQCMRICPGLV